MAQERHSQVELTPEFMSQAKAIELLRLLRDSDDIDITQDEKDAINMGIVALFKSKLNL